MKLNDVLTKDLILDSIGQEAIFSHYLYTPDLSKRYTNPFRADSTPGCTFYYNRQDKLYFVDNGWGKKHYDCFTVVQEIYGCSFGRALQHIYEDFKNGVAPHITSTIVEKKSREEHNLRITRRDFNKTELAFWNIGGLQLTQAVLESAGIFAVKTMWEYDYVITDCHMTFAYIEDGLITQIYKPLNKGTNRRRFINRNGFILGGYNSLPFLSDYVIITKSGKCNFYLNHFDITSCYVVHEHIVLDEEIITSLKTAYKNVFTLFDNDRTGKHLAWMYRKLYGIKPLFVPEGKDATEYLAIVGEEKFKQTKEEWEKQLL